MNDILGMYAMVTALDAENKARKCEELIDSGNRRIDEAIRKASEADIEARDRVNIPLKEYEKMKETIKRLTELNLEYEKYFEKIKFPYAQSIVPESIKTWYMDYAGNPLDFTKKIRYRIEFDVKMGMEAH